MQLCELERLEKLKANHLKKQQEEKAVCILKELQDQESKKHLEEETKRKVAKEKSPPKPIEVVQETLAT